MTAYWQPYRPMCTSSWRILWIPVDPQRPVAPKGPAFYARRGKRGFITPVVFGIG